MRLIDADALLEKMIEDYNELPKELYYLGMKWAYDMAKNAPTIDAQPVVHGKWINVDERLPECDNGTEIGNIEWIICGRVYAGCFGRGGKMRDAYFRTWTDATEGIDAKDAQCWRAVTIPDSLTMVDNHS